MNCHREVFLITIQKGKCQQKWLFYKRQILITIIVQLSMLCGEGSVHHESSSLFKTHIFRFLPWTARVTQFILHADCCLLQWFIMQEPDFFSLFSETSLGTYGKNSEHLSWKNKHFYFKYESDKNKWHYLWVFWSKTAPCSTGSATASCCYRYLSLVIIENVNNWNV